MLADFRLMYVRRISKLVTVASVWVQAGTKRIIYLRITLLIHKYHILSKTTEHYPKT